MVDTARSKTILLSTLFADGQGVGEITPQDMRDLIVSLGYGRPLAMVGSASSVLTGNTNETALGVVSVDATHMGQNGSLLVNSIWSGNKNANVKTIRVRFGADGASTTHSGTVFAEIGFTNANTYTDSRQIINRNDVSSQIGAPYQLEGGIGVSPNTVAIASINTNAACEIEFSGQLSANGDFLTLEAYTVQLLHS